MNDNQMKLIRLLYKAQFWVLTPLVEEMSQFRRIFLLMSVYCFQNFSAHRSTALGSVTVGCAWGRFSVCLFIVT